MAQLTQRVEREVIVRDVDLYASRSSTVVEPSRRLTIMEYLRRYERVTDQSQIVSVTEDASVSGIRLVLRQEVASLPFEHPEPPGMVRHVLRHWWSLLQGVGAA